LPIPALPGKSDGLFRSLLNHAHAANPDPGNNAIVRYGPIEHAGSYARPELLKEKILVVNLRCRYWDCIKSAFHDES
jgi:hypothetical protein